MNISSTSILFSFLLSIALLSVFCLAQSPHNVVFLIGKDPKTNLFYTTVGIGAPRHNFNLVIDLGGPFLWYDCNNHYNSSTYEPLHCDSPKCPAGSGCTGCSGPFKPGCTNDTCGASILNPFADAIFSGDTGEDTLFLPSSRATLPHVLSGCTNSDGFSSDPSLLQGLPKGSKGILGLGRTQLALPTQLSASHSLKFSLCLPSSNKKGLGNLFIASIPRSIVPLLTTKLIVNPFSTAPIFSEGDPSYEYFIGVKSIKIDGKVLNFNSGLLSIDGKGNGGTKISTMNPFTVLRSSIYKPLVREFLKRASDRKMKKVAAVAPFEACFDFNTIGRTNRGFDVPIIDLVLQEGVQWTIYGGNSMVLVKKNVACLGFVDGGKESRTSVVIGGHQLEENLLEFDLVSSKLSFSSSLLRHNARCSQIRG